MDMDNAVTFAVILPGLLVAHNVADHWVQTHHQSVTKGRRDRIGQIACAKHVASYIVVTAGVTGLLWLLFGLDITWLSFTLGQIVSAVTHYWADRRWTLEWLARLLRGRNDEFYRFGKPRPGCDDNPTMGTGAYALDQSWHWLWLLITALLTSIN